MIIRICTPSYTCAICFLPLYSARYNGKSVSSTASKSDWFISAFADLWHGVGLNRLVLPSESLCPSIRTSVPYLGLRRCTVGPLTLSRNTIYCISFLIIPQYNVFVNQFMRKKHKILFKTGVGIPPPCSLLVAGHTQQTLPKHQEHRHVYFSQPSYSLIGSLASGDTHYPSL